MKNNPVGWFEIPVTDMDRAEKFYSEFLSVEMKRQPENMGVLMSWFPSGEESMKMYGAMGALVRHQAYIPSHSGTIVYFSVSSIDEYIKKAESMGRKVLFPNTAIGEYGFIAWIDDTEGNTIALHSMNK